jgi:hypothetical protein
MRDGHVTVQIAIPDRRFTGLAPAEHMSRP